MLITKLAQRQSVGLLAAGTPAAPILKNTSYHCMSNFHYMHCSYSCTHYVLSIATLLLFMSELFSKFSPNYILSYS